MPFSKPRVDVFSRGAAQYDLWYEKHRFLYLSELKLISSLSGFPAPSLEVGVGTGRFASLLKIKIGLDPSLPMLKIASQRGIQPVLGLGEKLPFSSGTLASVLMAITLCFLEDPLQALKEVYRVLYPGGELVLAFVERDSPWGGYYYRKPSPFYRVARFFSFGEVEGMLKESGFNMERTMQVLFYPPGSEERLEESLEGTGRGSFLGILARKPY